MIARDFSADRLNRIVNDPAVYPWVRGQIDGPIDLTQLVTSPTNFNLLGEHGGIVFSCLQPGIYEAHTLVLPSGRGKWAFDMVHEALAWMFLRTDAIEILTRCPKGNVAAKALTRAVAKSLGGTFEFTAVNGWFSGGQAVPADIYGIRIQDWTRNAIGLCDRGKWFHSRLESEFARLGRKEEQHPDDEVHDRYVGMAVEMIRLGNAFKAEVLYNRWAAMANYGLMRIITQSPLMIDIGNALVVVRGEDFWVPTLSESATGTVH